MTEVGGVSSPILPSQSTVSFRARSHRLTHQKGVFPDLYRNSEICKEDDYF